MHRVDAQLTATGAHEPIPTDLAADGIAEYVEAFVATALATGAAPEADATLHLELTDTDAVVSADLPRPHPGDAAARLAPWHRRDPLGHMAHGDRDRIADWPRI